MKITTADLLTAATSVAGTATQYSAEVDADARFPLESVEALREHGLLAAAAGAEHAGQGADAATLVRIAAALARGCGSTAMIWAMHQVQLACLVRHGAEAAPIRALLHEIVADQWLIASATSEVGVGGDLRRSKAAVEPVPNTPGRRQLAKRAPTVSYGAEAQALLVTARRSPQAAAGNQVAVLLTAADAALTRTGQWQPLGMRGTCSPAFEIDAEFDEGRVLPVPFADIAADTMVPLSHLLWAGVWTGLATEALARATSRTRQSSGQGGRLLAEGHWKLTELTSYLADTADYADAVLQGKRPATTSFTARLNALKIAASQTSLEIAQLALQASGMAGYSEIGPYSVARILRDLHSAALMIGNERLLAANAELVLMDKTTFREWQ
jgi:acyl-CoA dehydrogenase